MNILLLLEKRPKADLAKSPGLWQGGQCACWPGKLSKNDNGAIRHLPALNLRARETALGPLLALVGFYRPPKGTKGDGGDHCSDHQQVNAMTLLPATAAIVHATNSATALLGTPATHGNTAMARPAAVNSRPKNTQRVLSTMIFSPKTARVGLAYGLFHRKGQTAFAVWPWEEARRKPPVKVLQ